jgi:hypothetical protein
MNQLELTAFESRKKRRPNECEPLEPMNFNSFLPGSKILTPSQRVATAFPRQFPPPLLASDLRSTDVRNQSRAMNAISDARSDVGEEVSDSSTEEIERERECVITNLDEITERYKIFRENLELKAKAKKAKAKMARRSNKKLKNNKCNEGRPKLANSRKK